MKKLLLPVFLFTLIFSNNTKAQSNLLLDPNYSPEVMIMDFFDCPNISISNVTSTGDFNSIAFFESSETDLGLDAGILLSSGPYFFAQGPNNTESAGASLDFSGDADIDLFDPGLPSFDATTIEFDFTVSESELMHFNYVFASEEYLEWVNSQFNDAFGFFISGPSIDGDFSNNAENIAMIPGTNQPVSINNVNHLNNPGYYIHNTDGTHLQYDGYTEILPAYFYAEAGETYHIKIVVADRADAIYDSAVFLSFNSLTQDSLLAPIAEFQASVNANSVSFDNTSRYSDGATWDFGNDQYSDLKNPPAVFYQDTGEYEVYLVATNYCCKDTYMATVSVDSIATISSTVATTNNPLNCHSDANASIEVDLINASLPLVSMEWTPAIDDINNVGAGTYSYEAIDQDGTSYTGSVTIEAPEPMSVSSTIMSASNNNGNGYASVMVEGGTPPFQFLWSNGQSGNTVVDLFPGEYQVFITDANGCSTNKTVTVEGSTNTNEVNNDLLKIYPNPVIDFFKVEGIKAGEVSQFYVFDAIGKMIPVDFENDGASISVQFRTSLAKGIYFINVELTDGSNAVSRFVVN